VGIFPSHDRTIRPKNKSHIVAAVAGGVGDVYRQLRRKLREAGIDAPYHFDSEKPGTFASIPRDVDVVIFLRDMATDALHRTVVAAANKQGVPVVRTMRKWSVMSTDLAPFRIIGKSLEPLPADPVEDAIVEARARAERDREKEAARREAEESKRQRDEAEAAEFRAAEERARRFEEKHQAERERQREEAEAAEARRREHERRQELINPSPSPPPFVPPSPRPPAAAPFVQARPAIPPAPNGLAGHRVEAPAPLEDESFVAFIAGKLRALPDAKLVAACGQWWRDQLAGAFDETPPPRQRKPMGRPAGGGAMAQQRQQVLSTLRALCADDGAVRVASLMLSTGLSSPQVQFALRALREERLAFQAGWSQHSYWALSQAAATRAAEGK